MPTLAPYAAQHAAANGPGDARPTALQIVKDQGLEGKLAGKVMIVTGASSGIGVETARALHATGADVYVTARDMQKLQGVIADIKSDNGPGKVEPLEMQLDSFASIKRGAAEFLAKSDTLNILVNNAGIMACPEGQTQDGHELQFGTNHLGHFLLFQLLKPTLLASATSEFPSRVVNLSSTAHRNCSVFFGDYNLKQTGYEPWKSYGQSKSANIFMANEIERRYGSKDLHAFSLHPGGIGTPLQRHLDPAMMANAAKDPVMGKSIKDTAQGAATTVWAALAKEFHGRGGIYLEDCQESEPRTRFETPVDPGYAPHIYDAEQAKRLWTDSLEIVGVSDDA